MDKKSLIIALRKFKKRIEKKQNVQKIILFGSRARGKPKKESDVDLVIISNDYEGVKSFKRSPPLYHEWDLDLPVDFICLTPEEFKTLAQRVTVTREAQREGIEIT